MTPIDSSTEVGSAFRRRVLVRQAMIGVVAFMTVGLLAPWSLMLESQHLAPAWLICLQVGSIGIIGTMLTSVYRMRATRRVMEAMALDPENVVPQEIGALADLPFELTARFVIMGAVAAALSGLPQLRPAGLDDARAFNLALLMFTIICASGVAHYVAIRDATIRAIELSPLEPITAWLERDALRLAPRHRVVRKILLAIVVPVALIGVATVLVAHAHLRAFMESSRNDTAEQLARVAFDPIPGATESSHEDAVAAAAAHGFFIRHAPLVKGTRVSDEVSTQKRLITGQLETTLTTSLGVSRIRYEASLSGEAVTSGVWLALLAVLLAAALGVTFGRMLAADLVLATNQVASLGTETVMRGQARVAGPARFDVVAQLGRSVEALAERFRVFAAAQERALEAKSASRRMKQLLFASVSHDLKSPLNAILGFAELVRDEPLTASQLESLDLVQGRGRELLALIETILDAARVEAGQLQLLPAPVEIDDLVAEALATARMLLAERRLEVIVEIARGMPPVCVDTTYGGRAIAVLIAHAMQAASTSRNRSIRLRGSMPARAQYAGGDMARVDIEYVEAMSRPSMLEDQLAGKLTTGSGGRGQVLRLSLARTIIELHGGHVQVGRGPHGAAVVTCWLPVGKEMMLDDLPTNRVVDPHTLDKLEAHIDLRAPLDSDATTLKTETSKTDDTSSA